MCNVTLRHEFHGSCVNLERNGEPSHLDDNDALDRLLYIVSHRQAANFFTRMERSRPLGLLGGSHGL
jgi:hypothetical protein